MWEVPYYQTLAKGYEEMDFSVYNWTYSQVFYNLETQDIEIADNPCDFKHACLPFSLPSSLPVCHTKDKGGPR